MSGHELLNPTVDELLKVADVGTGTGYTRGPDYLGSNYRIDALNEKSLGYGCSTLLVSIPELLSLRG